MLHGILRNPLDHDPSSVTYLKVKMKCNKKQQQQNGKPTKNDVIVVDSANGSAELQLRTKKNSSGSLQVPVEKHARRLSDSLDVEKLKKHVPRVRRRSVSFDPFTIFKTAILDNDVETMRNVLVSGKVDANTAVDGVLPILLASKDGCAECLELLIESGAEMDVHDRHGMSPLELAVREGHFDCAQVLITAGANANCIRDGYFDDTIQKEHHLPPARSRSRTF